MNQELQKAYGLFENMPLGYAIFRVEAGDDGSRYAFYYANSTFLRLFHLTAGELAQADVMHYLPAGHSALYAEVASSGSKRSFYYFHRQAKKHLKVFCYQPLYGYCACLIDDVTEQFNIQQLLRIRAESDSLTGLFNKEATHEHVTQYLNETRARKARHAMIVLDLDNFKEINDYFGHLYGDALLLEISNRIKSLFRASDIVGRIGGDEFMIFMKNVRSVDIVQEKATDLCRLINENYNYFNTDLAITTSVGIALYPEAGTDFETLYNSADIALYQAKDKGKNQFHVYNGDPAAGNEILYSRLRKNSVVDKVYRVLAQKASPYENIRAAIKILCFYYGFRQGYLIERGGAPYHQYIVCRYPAAARGELPDPEHSVYISDSLKRQDYCYVTVKTAPEFIRSLNGGRYKTIYFFSIKTAGKCCGYIVLINPDKSLRLETEELGELTVSINIIVNYYLEIKENDKMLMQDYV
ncbi:MAG TPA: GGDEF domain-containing protein [Acholeplasmataceae bacterium]|nr:GGDEF domain-containing protein [Acholeplasmataceae bacterium]